MTVVRVPAYSPHAVAGELLARADIVTLHCPLTPVTHHMIDADVIDRARPRLLIVNNSRGALIDMPALIDGLALDMYEQEADLFFEDLSNQIIADNVFQQLLTFPNVITSGHPAFFTEQALMAIAETTLANIADAETGRTLVNSIREPRTQRSDP